MNSEAASSAGESVVFVRSIEVPTGWNGDEHGRWFPKFDHDEIHLHLYSDGSVRWDEKPQEEGWPHCPDCNCLPRVHDGCCWRCGAGVCQSREDCAEFVDESGAPLGATCSTVWSNGSSQGVDQ